MKIKLLKMKLKNFKGIKDLYLEFRNTTSIYGKNGIGKSTIFDAFLWVLFDKDSSERKQFEIQSLDPDGNVKHGLEHSVVLTLELDGQVREIEKVLTEKWVKKRGETESELKGTQTNYKIDGVPYKVSDFKDFVSKIITEDLFKILTNPLYFSKVLDWKYRRGVLMDVVGDVLIDDIIDSNKRLEILRAHLDNCSVDDLSKKTKASIKKLKEEIKGLPARIDELEMQIQDVDVESLEFRRRGIVASIKSLDDQLVDKSKFNEKKIEIQDRLFNAKESYRNYIRENEAKNNEPFYKLREDIRLLEAKVDNLLHEKSLLENEISYKDKAIKRYTGDIECYEKENEDLRELFKVEACSEFEIDTNETRCSKCGREYEEDKKEEILLKAKELFNEKKDNVIANIREKGTLNNNRILKLKENIEKLSEENIELSNRMTKVEKESVVSINNLRELKREINDFKLVNPENLQLKKEITNLEIELSNFKNEDVSDIKYKKDMLNIELSKIDLELAVPDMNLKFRKRQDEIREKESDLGIKIAELEGIEYLCEEFIKSKVSLLERNINLKFGEGLSFKMFNNQVNGGLTECCEVLINGVPFQDANTASKINAGLNIINTLNKHYKACAPVFIDNRESITNVLNIDTQLVNLIVSNKDEILRVEGEE